MKKNWCKILFFCCGILLSIPSYGQDVLPQVFSTYGIDKTGNNLRQTARIASAGFSLSTVDFMIQRDSLKSLLQQRMGIESNSGLELNMQLTGIVERDGFRIENILFQTQPGVYATANLYIPNGKGLFPAVVNLHGHWPDARRTEIMQTTAQILALNGYVCLNIDAWGAGERGTAHQHEYHGSNLGASLMDIGYTLAGLQLMDNIRGVDLLCSLSYVDKNNIGATGASGGGNQTMWLGAMDERVKAVVPVVSVGTFESYIMNSNCVCELVPGGLTLTEEGGVLGLIAPRALKMLTAMNEANPSFVSWQMRRSYDEAKIYFKAQDSENKIAYELFNTGHGYWPDMQQSMLAWFNRHLKGIKETPQFDMTKVELIPVQDLATLKNGEKDGRIISTEDFCRAKGEALRIDMLNKQTINFSAKRTALLNILSISANRACRKLHYSDSENGWEKWILEDTEGQLIPILKRNPKGSNKAYTLLCPSKGKDSLLLSHFANEENGIIIVDLWGLGERRSEDATRIDGQLPAFHTLSRATLWLGETVIGKWVQDMELVFNVAKEEWGINTIELEADKETALAAILFAAVNDKASSLKLKDMPVSYLFDNRENIDHFNMATHLPGILEWGGISFAAAMAESPMTLINPVTMSGRSLTVSEQESYKNEFSLLNKKAGKKKTVQLLWNKTN